MKEIKKFRFQQDPKELKDKDLLLAHFTMHNAWKTLKEKGKVEVSGKSRSPEDIINYAALIVDEMKRRGLEHHNVDELDEKIKPFLKKEESPYATVNPSGKKDGERLFISDLLPALKDFRVRHPYIAIVGGMAVHGSTEGDVDILIKDSEEEISPLLRQAIEFRISRALPPKFAGRVHFLYDRQHGPFTDHIPIYDLTFERVNRENQVIRMSAEPGELIKGPVLDAVMLSIKEDKIRLFRMFQPQKPVKVGPETPQTIDNFLELFEPDDFPVYSSKKFDGARHVIFKQGDKVEIWSEDGKENSKRLPRMVAAIKKLKGDPFVLDAELEMWVDGKHKPREAVAGYINAKTDPDDSDIVANVFDVLYFGDTGDIHTLSQEERLKFLDRLELSQSEDIPDPKRSLNKVRHLKANDLKQLERQTEEISGITGSEGNVAKTAGGRYYLDGNSRGTWKKFHKAAFLNGVVLKAIETATPGTFNYEYGIQTSGKYKPKQTVKLGTEEFWPVGKTFSTARKARPGDVLKIEFETLNLVHHREEDVWEITAWAPRVLEVLPQGTKSSTPEFAIKKAEDQEILQRKEIADGLTVFKASDPYLEYPDESKTYGYVMQHHYRGKTAHVDFRIEAGDKEYLIGWTIADQVPGKMKMSADEIARERLDLEEGEELSRAEEARFAREALEIARENDKDPENWKIDYSSGKFRERKTRAGTLTPAELRSFKKAREPIAWFDVEGTTPPFPSPGATKQFRGIFTIVDGTPRFKSAKVEYGRQAPQFHEYFLSGGKIKGRLIFRQLAREQFEKQEAILPPGTEEESVEATFWVAVQPIDQTPQFLSKRAVETGAMPSPGVSGLPKTVRDAIPEKYQYWKAQTAGKAKKIRDELVEEMAEGEVKLDFNRLLGVPAPETSKAQSKFVLQWHYWRGPTVVREGVSREQFYLLLDEGKASLSRWTMENSPLDTAKTSGTIKTEPNKKDLDLEGEVAPGTRLNPTKDTPSFVERLDEGTVTVLESGELFKKIKLSGKKLKGLWIAKRSKPGDAVWTFERSTEVKTDGGSGS